LDSRCLKNEWLVQDFDFSDDDEQYLEGSIHKLTLFSFILLKINASSCFDVYGAFSSYGNMYAYALCNTTITIILRLLC